MEDKIFNGADYDHHRDSKRLTTQYTEIFNLMKDRNWRSLKEISEITGYPEASISAQLRHARKSRFGSNIVKRHRKDGGQYFYQLLVNTIHHLEPEENRIGDAVRVPRTKGNISLFYDQGILNMIYENEYCKVFISHKNKKGFWVGKISDITNISAQERKNN